MKGGEKENWYFFFWLGEVGGGDSDNKEEFKEKKERKIKYKKFKNCGQVLMQGLIGTFYRLL